LGGFFIGDNFTSLQNKFHIYILHCGGFSHDIMLRINKKY